jgi:CelD/BcsL family acetyltransferase involved in cellulose biosynthesis
MPKMQEGGFDDAKATGELAPLATQAWLDLSCEATGGRDASCRAETPDGRPVTLPLVRIRQRARTVDWSLPPGFGAPGLLVDGPVLAGDLDPLAARLREGRAAEVRIRTTPADSAAWTAVPGAREIARQVPNRTHILDLTGGWDAVWAGFKGEARTGARKARRVGVSVHREDDAVHGTETYLAVWREWVRGRAARRHIPAPLLQLAVARRDPPRHYRLAAQRLGDLYEVWVAEQRGRAIAATLVLVHGPEAVMWRSASAPDADPARPNDLMMTTVIESLCHRDVQRYVLGESSGKTSLEHFKAKFGARAHEIPEILIRA